MDGFNQLSAPNTRPEQKPEQSKRSTPPGGVSLKKALALSALPLALLFGAAFQSSNPIPEQLQAIQSQISTLMSQNSALQAQLTLLANKGPRKFYLTQTEHTGATALSACAQDYHMASLWEIHEPSNLRYDTELGHTLADSGFGPPNNSGWIRTGFSSATLSATAGAASCSAWTTADTSVNGTTVGLNVFWKDAGTDVSPWISDIDLCGTPRRVWCVQD